MIVSDKFAVPFGKAVPNYDHRGDLIAVTWELLPGDFLRLNHPPAEAATDATSSVDYWQKRGHHVCPECNGTRVRSYRLAEHLGGQYVDAPCRCVASPAEASTWQPIESAPKDGTSVLLLIDPQDSAHSLHDDSFVVSIGSYGVEGGAEVDPTWCFAGWSWSHDEYVRGKGTPTHWMPLPGPPRAALSGRKEGSV